MSLIEATGGLEWIERHVDEALLEDLGERGDITCAATIPAEQTGHAELVAKQDGVLAGRDWAIVTGERTVPPAYWNFHKNDGHLLTKGEVVAEVTGPMHGILISERTALNGLGHLSGIATMAATAVKLVAGTQAKILDTRKTSPGWRLAEKYAIKTGGASNHRIGLYDEFLVKENHISASGGITNALGNIGNYLAEHYPDEWIPVEIEVESLEELAEALKGKPDRVLLDNFSVPMLIESVSIAADTCELEASGGITLENLKEVASSGVHRISLGALTHSVKPLDFSLLVR